MKQKYRLIYYIFVWLIACKNPTKKQEHLKGINQDTRGKSVVEAVQQELSKSGLSEVNDSIRFYLYNLFYDKSVEEDSTSARRYYCSFEILPIRLNSSDTTSVIEYQLFNERHLENDISANLPINLIQVEYTYGKDKAVFSYHKLAILGEPYIKERITSLDPNSIIQFIRLKKIQPNKWLIEELAKRGFVFHS